jgi:hypothetical protein
MTKPGEARLVKVSTKESRAFNIDSLSSVEADLMSSAGAVARSSRRSSMWTDGAQSRESSSPDIDAAAETVFPKRGRQQSNTPKTVPGAEEHTAIPPTRPVGQVSSKSGEDERFRQLVRKLETNGHESNQDAGHALVPELSRVIPPGKLEQHSMVSTNDDQWATKKKQFSPLEHKPGYFCLNDPTQRRTPVDDGSTLTLPSKIPVNPNRRPGDSDCPSLISDDGREPSAPGDMADDRGRTPIFQRPPGISGWEKEDDTLTAPNGTPSESSFTLVNTSVDENELSSRVDTDDDHADENTTDDNTSSCGGHGWWYREPRAIASPLSFHHGSFYSRLRERHERARRTSTRQPNELELYPQSAILRWLISETDAPGTPGMLDESSVCRKLLQLPHEYLPRYGDNARAQIWRVLRFLTDPEEPLPEPSQEVRAFLREIYPQAVTQEGEGAASVAHGPQPPVS